MENFTTNIINVYVRKNDKFDRKHDFYIAIIITILAR